MPLLEKLVLNVDCVVNTLSTQQQLGDWSKTLALTLPKRTQSDRKGKKENKEKEEIVSFEMVEAEAGEGAPSRAFVRWVEREVGLVE